VRARYTGRVSAFDDHTGRGEVEVTGAGMHFPFHCTAIADGTRTIAVGTGVEFVVGAGAGGQWEATHIERR
jgi:cold shock CspA family protein